MGQVCQALDLMSGTNDKPIAIIADTVKGKGISFIENTYKYHNFMLTKEEYLQAEQELLQKAEALANV
jgi:transketolase